MTSLQISSSTGIKLISTYLTFFFFYLSPFLPLYSVSSPLTISPLSPPSLSLTSLLENQSLIIHMLKTFFSLLLLYLPSQWQPFISRTLKRCWGMCVCLCVCVYVRKRTCLAATSHGPGPDKNSRVLGLPVAVVKGVIHWPLSRFWWWGG